MRIKTYNLLKIAALLFILSAAVMVRADSTTNREYQIKAAFLYNFINFIDWPNENSDGNKDNPIYIGILGKNPFGNSFEPIKDKQVKDRNVVVKHFENLNALKKCITNEDKQKQCYLLYVSSSEKENINEIFEFVNEKSILTVGDMKNFLESGGIINFLMEDNKVCFEINKAAAEKAKLSIRSKLLRLAKRVVPESN